MTIDLAERSYDEPRRRVAVIAPPANSGSWSVAGQGAAPDSHVQSASRLDADQERMLAALERAYPVRFEPAVSTEPDGVDGVLALGPASLVTTSTGPPRLILPLAGRPRDCGGHCDGAAVSTVPSGAPPVVLSAEFSLPRPLRGRAIPESATAGEPPLAPAGGAVLASVDGKPVWWQIGDAAAVVGASAYPLAGLRDGEALRDHLRAGRFMGLLPLVHFLARVLGAADWRAPTLRASFVIDDPNLHRPSYGFLNYQELAVNAAQQGYHVGIATVPIDGWRADRRVTSLLAENRPALSLLIHGNDHVARELGRLETDAEALPAIAQALRRIAALERRSGVAVERVMAPPHEACSEAALRAMFRLGLEAACICRPYPWRDGLPAPTPLAGWNPAELVAGGLPVLPRYPLGAPIQDLALRAMLGQPLILYGHHRDFAHGPDVLAHAAEEINGLGDVQWGPLGWIARRNYATRQLGETLFVKMHARRITVDIPAGVRALQLVVPEPLGGAAGHRLTHSGNCSPIAFEDGRGASELLAVDAPTRMDLALMVDQPLSPTDVPSPGVSLWPWIRRALVEGRDRVQALS